MLEGPHHQVSHQCVPPAHALTWLWHFQLCCLQQDYEGLRVNVRVRVQSLTTSKPHYIIYILCGIVEDMSSYSCFACGSRETYLAFHHCRRLLGHGCRRHGHCRYSQAQALQRSSD